MKRYLRALRRAELRSPLYAGLRISLLLNDEGETRRQLIDALQESILELAYDSATSAEFLERANSPEGQRRVAQGIGAVAPNVGIDLLEELLAEEGRLVLWLKAAIEMKPQKLVDNFQQLRGVFEVAALNAITNALVVMEA